MKWAGSVVFMLLGMLLLFPFMAHYSQAAGEFCITPTAWEVLQYAWVTAPQWMKDLAIGGIVLFFVGVVFAFGEEEEEREGHE